jgi:hypothetical protein
MGTVMEREDSPQTLVRRAQDGDRVALDRLVALKVLPAGIAADDRAFQRFLREAQVSRKSVRRV